MKYPFTAEQMALIALSQTSWRRRASAKRHKLCFDEEAVTQTILMDLADHYPGNVVIVPFNKIQEGKTGSDWAWAFLNSAGTSVLPMLVQAKALDLQDIKYPEIKHLIGKTSIRQIDQLITFASQLKWPAIYAFYNHLDKPNRIPGNCDSMTIPGWGFVPETWGISFADAYDVRAALDKVAISNDQSFDSHRIRSKPLHCLLCSQGSGTRPAEGSAGLALQSLKSLRASRGEKIPVRALDPHPLMDRPLSELPDVFRDATELSLIENAAEREHGRQRLVERYPNIAGVVIMRDAKPL